MKFKKLKSQSMLAFKPQSFIDVITNSSSELFICDIDKSLEAVKELLDSYPGLHGYQEPWIFKADDYIKAKENDFKDTFDGFVLDERYRSIDFGYFYHPSAEVFLKEGRKQYINYGFSSWNSRKGPYNDRLKDLDWDDTNKEIEKIYKEIQDSEDFPKWWVDPFTESKDFRYDIRELNNNIIIMSTDDNSIPYEYFDILESHFNAKRFHLG